MRAGEVHEARLEAGEGPRLVEHQLDVQVRLVVHDGDGLAQGFHRAGRNRLVGVAAHRVTRLDGLHRREGAVPEPEEPVDDRRVVGGSGGGHLSRSRDGRYGHGNTLLTRNHAPTG